MLREELLRPPGQDKENRGKRSCSWELLPDTKAGTTSVALPRLAPGGPEFDSPRLHQKLSAVSRVYSVGCFFNEQMKADFLALDT